MRKKVGFTLIELLVVIAILAILAILAFPNVIQMVNTSKEKSFSIEAKEIYGIAKAEWINDNLFEGKETVYSKCESGCSNNLDLDGRDDFEYYIKVSKNGKINKYYVTDGVYQFRSDVIDLDKEDINEVEKISNLEDDEVIDISDGKISNKSGVLPEHTLLQPGIRLNTMLKRLIPSEGKVTSILRSSFLDDNVDGIIIISESNSRNPVYAWYNNNTIYFYSEDEEIFLNENSARLFYSFSDVEEIALNTLNTSLVKNMHSMFYGNPKIESLDLSNFDTSNVTNMAYMFYGDSKIESLDLSNFDTSNVTNMAYMFYENKNLANLNISSFDTSNVTNMSYMFCYAYKLTNLDLKHFDTSNVTNMAYMFYSTAYNAANLNIDVSNWDTSKVESLEGTFYYTGRNSTRGKIIGLGTWDTSSVTNMNSTFRSAGQQSPEAILDVSNWNTSNVTNMSCLFYAAMYSVVNANLDLSNWDTSKVTNMSSIFFAFAYKATNIKINIKNFDFKNVLYMYGGFSQIGYQKSGVMIIDASNVDFTQFNATSGNYFQYTTNNSANRTYVKDETNRDWLINKWSSRFNTTNTLIGSS